jgi:hypothetical protein
MKAVWMIRDHHKEILTILNIYIQLYENNIVSSSVLLIYYDNKSQTPKIESSPNYSMGSQLAILHSSVTVKYIIE